MAAQYKDPKMLAKIQRALLECGGNKKQAAKMVGISRGQLYRALEELGWDKNAVVEGNKSKENNNE